MPRARRILGDDVHYHIIVRCNNGEFLLKERDDFQFFLDLLAESKTRFYFRLYNYTLLHSHAHLILSTHKGYFVNEVMHQFCLSYSRNFNKRHGRTGHLWKNRYRCKPILTEAHALACLRYQHRNPDKAGIVSNPGQWPWCGYRFYAFGLENPMLTYHPTYLGLAADQETRQRFYRKIVEAPLTSKECGLLEGRARPQSKRFQMEVARHIQQVSGTC